MFHVPDEARAYFRQAVKRGARWEGDWQDVLSRYRRAYHDLAGQFERVLRGVLPADWAALRPYPYCDGDSPAR